ncbi:MAG: thiamine diphosphokinase [Calditrichaeota bacterium]|nr:MAG: thiamine diphosphokinase [Calditrichota bacterium]
MKRVLLIAHGELSDREFEKIRRHPVDGIIAADGGAIHALERGLVPRYVVGDLDSVTPEIRVRLPETEFVHRPSQEINDLEKALMFCQELGVEALVLAAITGRRLDHTLNNLSVFSRYDQKFRYTMYDAHSRILLIRDRWEYTGPEGQLISLIPLGKAEGITTEGLAFPLNNESLIFGLREGLSNYIVTNPVRITVQRGLLCAFVIDPE